MLNGPNANIYALCSFFACLDVQILAYLPWLNSPFSRMSKGFPNLLVFRVVSWTTLLSTVAIIALQVPFLLEFQGPSLNKGFSGLSVALNCGKLLFALVTYFLKASSLAGASTEPDLEELKQWEYRDPEDSAHADQRMSRASRDLGGGDFFYEEYSRRSRSVGLVAPAPATTRVDDNDVWTMNPLFQRSSKVRRMPERTASREEPSEPLTINPLHRPEVDKPGASSDFDDDEYTSMEYATNPTRPSPMAIPSIKDKGTNYVQNDDSTKDSKNSNDNENDSGKTYDDAATGSLSI